MLTVQSGTQEPGTQQIGTQRGWPRRLMLVILLAGLTLSTVGLSEDRDEENETMSYDHQAEGTFDVKVDPLDQQSTEDGLSLGRYGLDKQYHGDLTATAKGQMLTVGTPVEGSATYVATERVEGSLGGKKGSFALRHVGVMGRGDQNLDIEVVLDSGTGELVGLEGELAITIADGKHFYNFRYSLPARR